MILFDDIKRPIAAELEQTRTLMEQTLRTRVPLADSVIRYLLDRTGKQVRPIMTLLAARMIGGCVTPCTHDGAVALELLHNATLMHDDVVDESAERRGAATVNRVWDNNVAVLMGDFYLSKCLVRSNATGSLAISKILADMVTRLSEGELEQLANMRSRALSEESYFSVISGKTASLFAACMRVGALSVGAAESEIGRLALTGEKMGLVFQIRDDLFDYFPSTEVGKPTGHDIAEGKITLPLLYALQHAPAAESERMCRLLDAADAPTSADVSRLVDFAIAGGGIEYATAKMKSIAYEAKTLLRTFAESDARQALIMLTDYFMEREK